jgi:hypothetical protein
VVDLDAALGEQFLDVTVGQPEAQVRADSKDDDLGREAEAGESGPREGSWARAAGSHADSLAARRRPQRMQQRLFNQLPCLGVECSSSRSASRLASAGANASYSDAGVWVFGVVLHQHDPLGVGVVDIDQVLDAVRPVDAGAPLADRHVAPAAQRLADQEQVAHAAAGALRCNAASSFLSLAAR